MSRSEQLGYRDLREAMDAGGICPDCGDRRGAYQLPDTSLGCQCALPEPPDQPPRAPEEPGTIPVDPPLESMELKE